MTYLEPILQSIAAGIGVIITALIGIYVPRLIASLETQTGIQLTAQQQATVLGAATTAAGILQTQLDQGVLKLEHITVDNPAIVAQAAAAVARVPAAAAALDKSVPSMAATIVGLVDTSPKPPTIVVPVTASPAVLAAA
jgi:hypothetical protein